MSKGKKAKQHNRHKAQPKKPPQSASPPQEHPETSAPNPIPKPPTPSKEKRSTAPKTAPRRWKRYGAGAFSLVTLLLSVPGVLSLLPRMNISPLSSIRQNDEMGTVFAVTNNGMFSVHDVTCFCGEVRISSPQFPNAGMRNSWLTSAYPDIGTVSAGQSASVPCEHMIATPGGYDAQIEIMIRYRPSFWPWTFTDHFPFTAEHTDTGGWFWKPGGPLMSTPPPN